MSRPATIFMFAGLGSQHFQMGRDLFQKNPIFRYHMQSLDEVAAGCSGGSVVDVLYDGSRSRTEPFDDTSLSCAATFMVEYSLARTLMASGIEPDLLLGASLGTYAALAVAGAVSAEDLLVSLFGLSGVLDTSCPQGCMIAVLASPDLWKEEPALRTLSETAGIHFASHFVISTLQPHRAAIESALNARNVVFHPLPVSRPFHSRWIDAAEARGAGLLKALRMQPPRTGLVCCCGSSAAPGGAAGNLLWEAIRRPIRFQATITNLEQAGFYRYVDVGPMGTLSTFLKYGLPASSASQAYSIMTMSGEDSRNLDGVLASLT